MKFSASTIILFGLGVLTTVISASSSPQSRICRGATGGTFDEWCNQNCNHNPPFCPESLCFCEEEPEPPSQEANTTCVAVGTFGALIPGADEWCASVCLSQPGFCPPAFCSCSNGTAPTNQTLATVNPNVPGCCQGDQQYLFFSGVQDNSSVIYRHSLSSDDSEPEECYVFEGGNPTSIVIDSNDNLWIADPVLGTVTRASTSCEGDVEIVLSWNEDTTVAAPTALAIVAGEGLIVGGTSGAFFIRFATDGTVFDVTALEGLNGTAFITSVIKVWDRTAYFVSTDSRIMEYDLDSQEFAEFDLGNFTTTGFGGITLNDCGLYFTTITSNQIYFCPDADPTRCHLHCAPGQGLTSGDFVIFNETDSSLGCVNTFNPGDLVSGCCCDVYITNQGNGCVTGISSERSTGTDEDKMFIPDLLACNLTLPQAIAFYSPNESGDSEDCPAQECTNSDTSIQAGNDPSPEDSNNRDSSTGGNTEEEDKSGYESQQKQTTVAQPPLHL